MASPEAVATARDWYSIVVPALLTTILVALGAITHYFQTRQKEDITPTDAIVSRSVGAAFVDNSVAQAILRIDAGVGKVVEILTDRAQADHDQKLLDAAADRMAKVLAAKAT